MVMRKPLGAAVIGRCCVPVTVPSNLHINFSNPRRQVQGLLRSSRWEIRSSDHLKDLPEIVSRHGRGGILPGWICVFSNTGHSDGHLNGEPAGI